MTTQYIGIDIGSTCAKTAVLSETGELALAFVLPTGWSSVDTAETIRRRLCEAGCDPAEFFCVSTGYGRVSVPFARKRSRRSPATPGAPCSSTTAGT